MKSRARAVSYFLTLAAVAAVFFAIEFITEKFLYPDDETVDILAAVIGALLFSRFKMFFDRATDRVFARAPRDPRAEIFVNVSHELQTPIAILRGNVEMLQRPGATPAQRACAERTILSTLDGMSRLIAGVLAGAKARACRQALAVRAVPVASLLAGIYDDCLLLAENKKILFSLVETEEGILIRADPLRIREVLLNLVSNALKHTPPGGAIALSAWRTDGGMAEIAVRDSGSGIAPEDLPHVFERFYRIRGAERAAPGTGIGLNICREIVETHGGTIRAESEMGKGSRFVVSLPLAAPGRPARPARPPDRPCPHLL